MIKSKAYLISLCLLLMISLVGCTNKEASNETNNSNTNTENITYADTTKMDFTFTDRELSGSYENAKDISNTGNNGILSITTEGTYLLSGKITDRVIVEVKDDEKVQIVLDNADISNSSGPAIYIKNADKVFITLKSNTSNSISDGNSYEMIEDDSTLDGAIFSKADLVINGSGTLSIHGNNKHGIVSKDDLVIVKSTLEITSNGVGLNGKDCVMMKDVTVNIDASSDGIRSDNDEEANRGYIYIENGTINIDAKNDGIQAETIIKLSNPTVTITAGGGSDKSLTSSEESYKGLKASSDILIDGGTYIINSLDDCIHSNNTMSITDGTFELSSGDDGIHADTDLSITGGAINIAKSYEGLEASKIVITDGNISIVASDDGLNAAGGNDNSGIEAQTSNQSGGMGPGNKGDKRPGMGNFSSSTGEIYIKGGYILIDASGDGIDSNGPIEITGGVTLVNGPTNGGNAALDYDSNGTINGGTLIALGSAQMAQSITSDTQGVIGCTFTTLSGGSSFIVVDANGNAVVSFTPTKSYSCAVISTPNIKTNETYTIVIGGNVSNTDVNGYTENSTYSDGEILGDITV